jgi:hypothetical protein
MEELKNLQDGTLKMEAGCYRSCDSVTCAETDLVLEGWQACGLSVSVCWVSTVPSVAPLCLGDPCPLSVWYSGLAATRQRRASFCLPAVDNVSGIVRCRCCALSTDSDNRPRDRVM